MASTAVAGTINLMSGREIQRPIPAMAGGTEEETWMNRKKTACGRRQFLRVLGASAAVAASPLVTEARADSTTADDKRKSRYKATEHIKAFYRVNRYPH